VFEKIETCRLCAVTTLKKEIDKYQGQDAEYVYIGTSKIILGKNL